MSTHKLKIDFHTHTIYSQDSINRLKDYEKAYNKKRFDIVVITDHDRIDAAQLLQKKASFPLIVGEEITTIEGDIIGVGLHQLIPSYQTAKETAQQIRDQGGLVYIPHPFDRFNVGIRLDSLEQLVQNDLVDFVEMYNDAFQTLPKTWNKKHVHQFVGANGYVIAAAGSDAHVPRDIGQAYVEIKTKHPTELLVSDMQLLKEEVMNGDVVGTTRFSPLSLGIKSFGHFRRKLIREPHL